MLFMGRKESTKNLKHVMDNPLLIVATCMGKPIYLESRKKLITTHWQELSPLHDSSLT